MKSVKFLLALQQKKGLTDTALAELLGISQPAVSHYKNGRRIMDDEACLAVAMALEVDPLQVIGAACIDRAEKTGQKSLWEVFMARTAATAAAVLMVSFVNLFLTPSNAEAATMRVPQDSGCMEYRLCALTERQPVQVSPPRGGFATPLCSLNCFGEFVVESFTCRTTYDNMS
jgi:transcriptional regulator with XRE-family HTH domain